MLYKQGSAAANVRQ
jgi:hypothetical protein